MAAFSSSVGGIALVIALEQLAGGMGTAAFLALIMAMTQRAYSATQFALLTAAASVARLLAGPLAGELASTVGWSWFFVLSTIVAVPGIVLVWLARDAIINLDQRGAATAGGRGDSAAATS